MFSEKSLNYLRMLQSSVVSSEQLGTAISQFLLIWDYGDKDSQSVCLPCRDS